MSRQDDTRAPDDITAFDILDFWWKAGYEKWYTRSDAFDAECRDRFGGAYEAAAGGALAHWADTPHGALALIVLLDQIPRNIFRRDRRAFARDAAALAVAEEALARGFDRAFPRPARNFFYMPFMHAEDLAAQERCVDLFRALDDKDGYFYALVHLDVIRRFGRFPHRNAVLGRETTQAEQRYLDSGGFAG